MMSPPLFTCQITRAPQIPQRLSPKRGPPTSIHGVPRNESTSYEPTIHKWTGHELPGDKSREVPRAVPPKNESSKHESLGNALSKDDFSQRKPSCREPPNNEPPRGLKENSMLTLNLRSSKSQSKNLALPV